MKNYFFRTFLYALIVFLPQLTLASERIAYFGGGCFWCTEADFAKIAGVQDVVSGYMGGHVVNPDYTDVSKGTTLRTGWLVLATYPGPLGCISKTIPFTGEMIF